MTSFPARVKRVIRWTPVPILVVIGPLYHQRRKKCESRFFQNGDTSKRKGLMTQILEGVCPGVLWSCWPKLVKFGQAVSEKCYLVVGFLRTGSSWWRNFRWCHRSGASTLNFVVLAQPVREIWSRVQICNIYKMADCSQPEVDSDIISGWIEDGVETNLCANFGDPASSGTFLFSPTRPPAHPPARPVRYDNTRSRSYASSSGKNET